MVFQLKTKEYVKPVTVEKTYSGTIKAIPFYDEASGYIIAKMEVNNSDVYFSMSLKGYYTGLCVNDKVIVTGEVKNDKYGNYIQFDNLSVQSDESENGICRYLVDCIKGIGEKSVKEIYHKLKLSASTLDILGSKDLKDIKGFKTKYKNINKTYKSTKHLIPLYLYTNGLITKNKITAIYDKYKEDAVKVLSENPYLLISMNGISFKTADKIALKLGIDVYSESRLNYGISFILETLTEKYGSTVYGLEEVLNNYNLLLNEDVLISLYYKNIKGFDKLPADISEYIAMNNTFKDGIAFITDKELSTLYENYKQYLKEHLQSIILNNALKIPTEDLIKLNVETLALSEYQYIYFTDTNKVITKYYLSLELRSAAFLNQLNHENHFSLDFDNILQNFRTSKGYTLDDDQKRAVKNVICNNLSIITGGPGTGKTTILECVLYILKEILRKDVILLAPTGKAAKRMSQCTGIEASTIHRYVFSNKGKYIRNNNTWYIIDEASMLDIKILEWMLREVDPKHLIFIGDIYQLPSIGAGAVLRDMLISNIPSVRLEHCHRNAGSISKNAEKINQGSRISDLIEDNHFETYFYGKDTDYEIMMQKIIDLYMENLSTYGVNEMVVLAPMKERCVCTREINKRLQNILHPDEIIKKVNSKEFRRGDRVIQLTNNYKADISETYPMMNGELFTILDFETVEDEEFVILKADESYEDGTTVIKRKLTDMCEMDLAYALTIHKSQGSEYKFVIVALTKADYMLLQRNLLYTAVTRAKEKIALIGQPYVMQIAIDDTSKAINRDTTLNKLIITGQLVA
jgi:exodeoxyribonuclease V alpha subunit